MSIFKNSAKVFNNFEMEKTYTAVDIYNILYGDMNFKGKEKKSIMSGIQSFNRKALELNNVVKMSTTKPVKFKKLENFNMSRRITPKIMFSTDTLKLIFNQLSNGIKFRCLDFFNHVVKVTNANGENFTKEELKTLKRTIILFTSEAQRKGVVDITTTLKDDDDTKVFIKTKDFEIIDTSEEPVVEEMIRTVPIVQHEEALIYPEEIPEDVQLNDSEMDMFKTGETMDFYIQILKEKIIIKDKLIDNLRTSKNSAIQELQKLQDEVKEIGDQNIGLVKSNREYQQKIMLQNGKVVGNNDERVKELQQKLHEARGEIAALEKKSDNYQTMYEDLKRKHSTNKTVDINMMHEATKRYRANNRR